MSLLLSANIRIILELSELLLFYYFICQFQISNSKRKLLGICLFCLITMNMVIKYTGEKYLDTVITPLCFLSVFCVTNCKFYKRALGFYIAELLLSIFNQIPVYVMMWLKGVEYYDWKTNGMIGVFSYLTFLIVELACYYILRKNNKDNFFASFSRTQIVTLMIGLHSCVFIIAVNQAVIVNKDMHTVSKIVYGLNIFCVTLVFVGVGIWLGALKEKNHRIEMEKQFACYTAKLQEQHYKILVEGNERMRQFRHDVQGHMTAIREFILMKQNEAALKYIDDIYDRTQKASFSSYTNCIGVDAVINDFKGSMKEKNIDFSFYGKAMIRKDIREFDLCTLFYNGIKNAIEACEFVEEERKIIISVGNYNDRVSIKMKNTCSPIASDIKEYVAHTKKREKDIHGLGISSMRLALEPYSGIIDFKYQDGWFETIILI